MLSGPINQSINKSVSQGMKMNETEDQDHNIGELKGNITNGITTDLVRYEMVWYMNE